MKSLKSIFLFAFACIIAATVSYAAPTPQQDQLVRKKARYYFMQGSLEASAEKLDRAYEYFKKAYELDPEYTDAAFNYGSQRIFLRTDTLQSDTELKRSMKMMQQYVDDNPLDLYAAQMYGYIATALDTIEESTRVFEKTYSLLPKETQLLQMLADAYMRTLQGPKAIESLERYEAIEGKSQGLSLKKITVFLSMNDTVGALNEADKLIAENPRDPYSHILKGNLYEMVGDMDSVYSAYSRANQLAPSNGAVKVSLANYYREKGDSIMLDNMMYEALLSEEFELEDKIGILGDYLQKLLDEEGDRTRGDYLFDVLQHQYPHEPALLEMAARYAAAKGDFAKAAEDISYAIDVDPTNEHYRLMLMSFLLTEDQYDRVIKEYQRAKEHLVPSPGMKKLYAGAASMLPDSERAKKIIVDLLLETDAGLAENENHQAIRKSLDYDGLVWVSSLYCMLGDLSYKAGSPTEGFDDYETALYFFPDNALALNNYAYFLSEEGKDLEKARKMSRRSLDLSEDNPTYLDTYAWILYKMGEYNEALEYIQLALDLASQQGDDNEEYQIHFDAIKQALAQ